MIIFETLAVYGLMMVKSPPNFKQTLQELFLYDPLK